MPAIEERGVPLYSLTSPAYSVMGDDVGLGEGAEGDGKVGVGEGLVDGDVVVGVALG
jgi:hypothetical protein